LKIIQVEYQVTGTTANVFRNVGTVTGGTTLTPAALRAGAQAAGATSKYNVTSVSGTAVYFVAGDAASNTYKPPASLMVAAGSVLSVTSTAANGLQYVSITFDEQRMQGGF
jgi:hypothetical protein